MDPNDLTTYEELHRHLGHTLPCYDGVTGCIAEDETNETVCCETGCLLLRVYREGYRAGKLG